MVQKTYVLIHGAWHGGWVWSRVAQRLRKHGHLVFTPTMTGCGERSHLLNRDTDLDLNIEDVLGVIQFEELGDVVLCGHSYAGMVISAVADRIPDAVRSLVYVDAYVPDNGDSVLELRSEKDNVVLMDQVSLNGDGWRMPPRSAEDFRIQKLSDRKWVDSHLTETALRCFTQPVYLTREKQEDNINRIYIRAGDYPNERFQAHYEQARASAEWNDHMIQRAGHDIMVDQPGELAEILMEA